jgi:hypothetical protein
MKKMEILESFLIHSQHHGARFSLRSDLLEPVLPKRYAMRSL